MSSNPLDDNVFSKREEGEKNEEELSSHTSTLLDTYIENEIGQGSLKSRIKRLRKQLRPHKNHHVKWNEVGICPICGINHSHPIAPQGKWRIKVWWRNLTLAELPERMCIICWAKDISLQELEKEMIEQKVGAMKRGKKFEMTRNEFLFWSQFYDIEKKDIEDSGEICEDCHEIGECLIERAIKKLGKDCKKWKR